MQGLAGGSGGGSRGAGSSAGQQPASPSGGFGNAGGAWTSAAGDGAGGGGGAGQAAPSSPPQNAKTGGPRGDGRAYDISGTLAYYAGGGGGGGSTTTAFGSGGLGGGGDGGNNGTAPTQGGPNTGGGGGGGNNSRVGADGGSGIVIIRYPALQTATPYENWIAANSLTGTDANADANPDNDTLSNLLEFAFGTDPNVADAVPVAWGGGPTDASGGTPVVVTPTFSGSGVNFTARFMRRQDHGDPGSVNYAWRFSSDLTDWESSDDSPPWLTAPNVLAEDAGGEYELVEIIYPFWLSTYRKARFFQVSVTEAP
jgi:hypothetical protein